ERPDQDLRNDVHPEARTECGQYERDRDEAGKQEQQCCSVELADHRFAPANNPCGRIRRTTLMKASEKIRANVGSVTLVTTPSRTASMTAAATVPSRLPSPPMITAMKQNGRMSTPVRNSTVVIGAAMAPPRNAMAVPSPKVIAQ